MGYIYVKQSLRPNNNDHIYFMKHFLVLVLTTLSIGLVSAQGLNWENGTWEEILTKAKAQDKVIFLDVYTTWCGPCLKMDKDVFPDVAVSEYYNETFITVKVNAEDNGIGTSIANLYDVKAYPTLLYVDKNGDEISKFIGLKNKYELINLGEETMELYGQYDFINQVKSNVHGAYNNEELSQILGITRLHTFEGKEHLTMRYLNQIESIDEDDLRLVMGEISRMELSYLSRLAPLTTSLRYSEIYLRRNSKEWISWKNTTEQAIYLRLQDYQENNDLPKFEETLEILKSVDGMKPRGIDNLYLAFYKQNSLDQYRTFATYLIDEYIIPTRPEEVKRADVEKYKMLQEEIEKDMQASFGTDLRSINSSETTLTPTIDSLSEIYTISKSIADQLFEISSDFFAFYEDEPSQRKAVFWSSLCEKYFPYDWKYYDNHMYILEASGKPQEAKEVFEKARALPWYQEMRQVKNTF